MKAVLRYPGAKAKVFKQMLPHLPKCNEFRDIMTGGGSVLLNAKESNLANSYWMNDIDPFLMDFWWKLQDCPGVLRNNLRILQSMPLEKKKGLFKQYQQIFRGEADFEYSEDLLPEFFFFLNRCSFNGATLAGGFSAHAAEERFTLNSIEHLTKVSEALREVRISNLDYQKVLEEPGEGVFIFVDCPYYSAEKLYGVNGKIHEGFDHTRLRNNLMETHHRLTLTIDDIPETRELYKDFKIIPWESTYSMGKTKVGKQLFVRNW